MESSEEETPKEEAYEHNQYQENPVQSAKPRSEVFKQASPDFIKKAKGLTAIVAMLTFVMIVIYPPMTLRHVDCIEDQLLAQLQSQNDFFKNNRMLKKFLMVIMGALTDILLLLFMMRWTYNGGSWRFMISLFLTYSLRLLFGSLFKMRSPEDGDLWEFPGIYSLTVQYGNQNDYYFNPTLSICIQLLNEYRLDRQQLLMWVSLLALVGDCYLSYILKGHYLIDNFGGIALGYYIWLVTNNWLCYFVDVKVFGMTIHERFPNQQLQSDCQNCGECVHDWLQLDEIEKLKRQSRFRDTKYHQQTPQHSQTAATTQDPAPQNPDHQR
mmetsp:Transcript_16452/g.27921  ORF Transcript_16452/g.27921 Transcript_16452/m.27921 type:complete len:325 (+) Transcript_16452:234-1208(+)